MRINRSVKYILITIILFVAVSLCLCGCDRQEEKTLESLGNNNDNVIVTEPMATVTLNPEPLNTPEPTYPSDNTPLIISEARVSSYGLNYNKNADNYDWVELINVSDNPVLLSNFFLSDDEDDLKKYPLPEEELYPGEYYVYKEMSLNAKKEKVYLSSQNEILDYLLLKDIPYYASFGRIIGMNGGYYFPNPTEGKENGYGEHSFSEKPFAVSPDGIFENVESVTVELGGEGTIYYTTDGNYPTVNDSVYTGPIELEKTAVIRAIAVQDGALPSAPITLSYFINEKLQLPIVSYVCDDFDTWNHVYQSCSKDYEVPGNVAVYCDDETVLNAPCGMSLTGNYSLYYRPKKGMNVYFRDGYGTDKIQCDLFASGEENAIKSFTIRSGTESEMTGFRNEIWETIGEETFDNIITQSSRFCVLFVHGSYRGIFCIKDNINKQWFADKMGTAKDSVDEYNFENKESSPFYTDVISFCLQNDMSIDENYNHVCDLLDVDNYIDWLIVEGVSGNMDFNKNVRLFRSSDGDGKWKFILFDLDNSIRLNTQWYLLDDAGDSTWFYINMREFLLSLLENAEFREALVKRYSATYKMGLTTEDVLLKFDEFTRLLEKDAPRDRRYWHDVYELFDSKENTRSFAENVNETRDYIVRKDWGINGVQKFWDYLDATDEEKAFFDIGVVG